MARVSVIIIALNQEDNIVPCLRDRCALPMRSWWWIRGSADRTLELARGFTDRIFTISLAGVCGHQKLSPWTRPGATGFSAWTRTSGSPQALRDEILAVVRGENRFAGYRVPRKNYFGGRWIRRLGWYPDYTLRLFRRDQGRFREREVHEEVVVDGPVGLLQTPLDHYCYAICERISRPPGPLRPAGRPGDGQGRAAALKPGSCSGAPPATF